MVLGEKHGTNYLPCTFLPSTIFYVPTHFYRRQKPPIRSCTNLEFFILFTQLIIFFESRSGSTSTGFESLTTIIRLLTSHIVFLPSQKALRLCNSNHQWPGNISGKRAEHRRIQYNLLKQLWLPCSCNCANRPTHRMRKKN